MYVDASIMATFEIEKFDTEQRRVFGWANVSITMDGQQIEDLHGDLIDPDVLEECAYEFVRDYGKSGDNHTGDPRGICIESIVFTPEKLLAMGLPSNALGPRWWVGFELPPDLFEKVKSGERRMFSIQGSGEREAVTP